MAGPDWLKYLKFRCTGCGNCCKDPLLPLTDADVATIIEQTRERAIDIVRIERRHKIRDVTVSATDEEHLHAITEALYLAAAILKEEVSPRIVGASLIAFVALFHQPTRIPVVHETPE